MGQGQEMQPTSYLCGTLDPTLSHILAPGCHPVRMAGKVALDATVRMAGYPAPEFHCWQMTCGRKHLAEDGCCPVSLAPLARGGGADETVPMTFSEAAGARVASRGHLCTIHLAPSTPDTVDTLSGEVDEQRLLPGPTVGVHGLLSQIPLTLSI